MLTVVAVLKAKAGNEKNMEEALKKLVSLVGQEEGTLTYALHRAKKEPARFLLYERYKDKEALAAHSSTSYFKGLFGTIEPLLDGQPSIQIYEEIAAIPVKE